MTKLQAIAKMLLFIFGVLVFKDAVGFLKMCYYYPECDNAQFILGLSYVLIYGYAAFFFIFQSDKLAVRLGKDGEQANDTWVAKLFIAAAIFAGVLLLAGCIEKFHVLSGVLKAIAVLPRDIARFVSTGEMSELFNFDFLKIIKIIAWLLKACVGLYLLFGMKKFIHWQIYKLKKLNSATQSE